MTDDDGRDYANTEAVRPRAVRRPDAIVLEASDGRDYRVSIRRLRTYRDVLSVARYLARRPGLTAREIAGWITVTCNAVGLDLPEE